MLLPIRFSVFYLFIYYFPFLQIARYMHNTHAKTHSGYTVEIAQIFRVSRELEIESFREVKKGITYQFQQIIILLNTRLNLFHFSSKFSNTGNRMLLWHGSRLTNWTGILSQGPDSLLSLFCPLQLSWLSLAFKLKVLTP